MGLDMYLDRYERCGGATPDEIDAVGDWIDYLNRPEKYKDSTFNSWCGREKPSDELIEKCTRLYVERNSYWDDEKKYGFKSCHENIGYWRKANQIHNWFVKNVQDGEDDCQRHREVTKSDLIRLLETCQTVVDNSRLVDGKVYAGSHSTETGWVDDYDDGKVIEDTSVAEELLPTEDGFFFGSHDYSEWYLEQIKETIEICKNALETTDFNKQMIYYCSSW